MAYAIGYLVVVTAIAAALRWQRPAWSKRKVVLTTTLPGPAILLIAGIYTAIYVLRQPAAPKEIDAGGMAMVAILMVSAGAALGALLGGLIAASLSVSLFRTSGDQPTSRS